MSWISTNNLRRFADKLFHGNLSFGGSVTHNGATTFNGGVKVNTIKAEFAAPVSFTGTTTYKGDEVVTKNEIDGILKDPEDWREINGMDFQMGRIPNYYLMSTTQRGERGVLGLKLLAIFLEEYYYNNLYAAKSDTYTKEEVDSKTSSGGIPTGTVFPFAGNNIPENYLLCDGSAVSRSTYANLFSVIGTLYGAGDGSTTFNLPNLVDRFVEGGNASGAVKNAGLPNIIGRLVSSTDSTLMFLADKLTSISGAFSVEGAGSKKAPSSSSYGGYGYTALNFDASKSNSTYGASSTVQPPAIVMKYIIKI